MGNVSSIAADSELVSTTPEGVRTEGFAAEAFEDMRSERSVPTFPEDSFADVLGKIDTAHEAIKAFIKWAVRPSGIALVFVSIAVAVLAKAATAKPNIVPYVQVVTKTCFDPKCNRSSVDYSALTKVSKNEQEQELVARTLLPMIFHQAMAISTGGQDQYDWNSYVLPFLKTGSTVNKWFLNYLQENHIDKIAASGTHADVTVDPVAAPSEPNHYFVSWVVTTISANGYRSAPQRFFANVTVEWGTPTDLNQNGMYLSDIQTVQPGVAPEAGSAP